jgi:hypothetical protein
LLDERVVADGMTMKTFISDFGYDHMSKADVTDWTGWVVSSMSLVSLRLSFGPKAMQKSKI